MNKFLLLVCCVAFGGLSASAQTSKGAVDFNRDVLPVLSENCFACHGFDANARKAGLRLDTPEGATTKLPSGNTAIVPGKPNEGTLALRVKTRTMPPANSGKKLTDAAIETLRRWVEQGAKYKKHWAFVPPQRPEIPTVKNKAWVLNPIDAFILARLEKEGLKPSPAADRVTLIRRLSLDLTGLPPTPAEVGAFLKDIAPNAYERLVDRLLASPRFGERMAVVWLDTARYADTHGFHIDSHRDMWKWREWVIGAFNRNLPYDQFIIEQLAGDLLPNPTLEQKIATGFNRNHPINFEGGAIPEEYHTAYIVDRIDTTATAFMGLTFRCAQCHDHKYDPFTQKDYYRFYAFFHNVPESGLDGQKGNAAPFLKAPSHEQAEQLESLAKKVAEVEEAMKTRTAETAMEQAKWEKTALAELNKSPVASVGLLAHYALDETSGEQASDMSEKQPTGTIRGKADWKPGKFGGALNFDGNTHVDVGATSVAFDRNDKFSYGAWVHPTSNDHMTVLSRMDDAANHRGWDLYLGEGKVFVHIIHQWEGNAIRVNTKQPIEANKWTHVFATYDGSSKAKGVKIYVNGKAAELDVTHDKLTDTIQTSVALRIGRRSPGAPFKGMIDDVRIYNRALSAAEVQQLAGLETIRQILVTAPEKRTVDQTVSLAKFYLENYDEPYKQLTVELADWKKKRDELDASIPTTMVMQEMEKPRETFLLIRGEYDKKGEKVSASTPEALPPLPKDAPPNRLGLAKWLVDPSHPLTARVAVNNFWQMIFGTGIVKTAENFGFQGERPSHPELLDWLAMEFMGQWVNGSMKKDIDSLTHLPIDSKQPWDIKALLKLIVTSNTYKQSSRVTKELLEKDPENRLLARAPRFRLSAEFIRDQALCVSGLLVEKIGGPSVKPYHPAGLWEEMAFGGGFTAQKYEQDHGEALYRRSMYTFWKRTVPPPTMQTFDAPEREFCVVRRGTTNTPLQALALMNETAFVEASRKFAERILTESPSASPYDRIKYAYRLALSRLPKQAEIDVLMTVLNQQRAAFHKDPSSAMKLLNVGESKRKEKLDAVELAAWATVVSVIMNLDEMIAKG
jgi:mono/diheme cytochrome c family protein